MAAFEGVGDSSSVAEAMETALLEDFPSPVAPGGGDGSRGRRSVDGRVALDSPARRLLHDQATRSKVAAFGGVPDAAASGLHSSARIRSQPNAEDTQLGRAVALAQRRDLPQGTDLNPSFSILSFSDEQVIQRAAALGVSLGSSHQERINSAKMIKNSDLHRTIHILEKNITSSREDGPHLLFVDKASSLSEDLVEDDSIAGMEDQLDLRVSLKKNIRTRSKKTLSSAEKRRSVRIKKQKQKKNARS